MTNIKKQQQKYFPVRRSVTGRGCILPRKGPRKHLNLTRKDADILLVSLKLMSFKLVKSTSACHRSASCVKIF